MPIDFAAVAARFEEQFARHTRDIEPLFERLADAVKILDERSVAAERATRGYPVLRYRDQAVALTVDAGGVPPLPRAATGLGFVDGLTQGWRRFRGELGFVGTAVEQELALPRLLLPVIGAADAILGSLERFERPRPSMFDPGRARFSDLFGVANLGWSSLLGSANQADLRAVAGSVLDARRGADALLARFGPRAAQTAGGAPTSGVADLEALATTVDEKTGQLVQLILVLPAASLALELALSEASLVARLEILTRLSSIEAQVYAIRVALVDELLTVTAFGGLAQAGLDAAEGWARLNAHVLSVDLARWVDELLKGLDGFLVGITAWGRWVVDMVEAARVVFELLMRIDLMALLMNYLFPSWVVKILPSPPSVTLDDIVGILIGVGSTTIRDTLDDWLETAEDVLYWTPWCRQYSYKIADLRIVLNTTLTATPWTYPPDVLPRGPIGGFPDVFDAVFGGGRQALLLDAVGRFGVELRGSVGGLLTDAATVADDLATTARADLERMATAGSGVPLQRLGASSVAMADTVFGAERSALLARQRQPSPLAASFDQVMAGGGIALAGALVPAYVGTIRRFWAARATAQERPTSAHILAKHGHLAMVRVPRLVVGAGGHEPDEAFAETVAVTFRAVVGDAYREGRDRMVHLARGGTHG